MSEFYGGYTYYSGSGSDDPPPDPPPPGGGHRPTGPKEGDQDDQGEDDK